MKKIITSIVCLLLATAIVLTVGFGSSWGDNWKVKTWFNYWGKGAPTETKDPAEDKEEDKGDDTAETDSFVVSHFEPHGIELLSARLPRVAYEANGVSALAQSAYVLTATLTPAYAENKAVDWGVAFVNPSSKWATGKNVTDYVTVTPESDGALSATVANYAPFGEQILITVTSRDNPDASSRCSADYLQTLESVTLKIGTVTVNLGGDTNVTVMVGKESGGEGGVVTLEKTFASVYTIPQKFSTERVSFMGGDPGEMPGAHVGYVSCFDPPRGELNMIVKTHYDDIENAVGKSIYFDRRLFSDFHFVTNASAVVSGENISHDTPWTEAGPSDFEDAFYDEYSGKKFWEITVLLSSAYGTYTYESALRWTGIDVFVGGVEDAELNQGNVIFQ